MCYYTITTDLHNKEGHTQAIMIIDAETEDYAKSEYVKTFNLKEYKIEKGIKIEDGFTDLLTSPIKKFIMKHKSGAAESNLVSYCNSFQTKYED